VTDDVLNRVDLRNPSVETTADHNSARRTLPVLDTAVKAELMDRYSLFPTPLFVYNVPNVEELNRELAKRLSTEAAASSGVRRANVGGWHSLPDLASRDDACYRTLMKIIVDHVGGTYSALLSNKANATGVSWTFGTQAWAMVMRDGDYTVLHDHGDAHWSTTYYVDAGDADLDHSPQSGALAVLDPRRGGRPLPGLETGSTFTIQPRTGMLVVFRGGFSITCTRIEASVRESLSRATSSCPRRAADSQNAYVPQMFADVIRR
jgi:hypothetical protein